ncbi:MAG: alpha/beta fold hydrolase [Pseudanabaenaceae cyanobacterium bins.68]|nr:alpha/beta fold hydrolase [Pseudanabaenaceae cyanobacterium bins.68]
MLIFVQHGWADNHFGMIKLAKNLTSFYAQTQPVSRIIAPNLGWWRTWYRMEPLIQTVETAAQEAIAWAEPWQIIGHSMGGLIWLELLSRHPAWQSQVKSLVLIGSPVNGSKLAHQLDPWGVGIARDLSKSRTHLAERIAMRIPTLAIAGQVNSSGDGTVALSETKFKHSQWRKVAGVGHAALRSDPQTLQLILEFWRSL